MFSSSGSSSIADLTMPADKAILLFTSTISPSSRANLTIYDYSTILKIINNIYYSGSKRKLSILLSSRLSILLSGSYTTLGVRFC
jgi:hypothetical protein